MSGNMCETDKKGLTELSEINLVRPFFVGFLFCVFWIVVTPLIIFFLSDFAGFEFFCLFLPCMEHIKHRKVGGSLGFVQPEAEFSVNLINVKPIKIF